MKKIFAIILVAVLIVGLAGCYADCGDLFDSGGRFRVVEHNTSNSTGKFDSYILVDEETGVLYALFYRARYKMCMTVLLNADGTPMTLEEK